MWPFPGAARNELAQSHTALSKVVILRAGKGVLPLTAVTGNVNTDTGRSTMRNLTATLTDPTGALSGADIDDMLNPYQAEVAAYRGVYVPSTGQSVYAPVGVYQLTARQVTGLGSIDITGQDRAIIYQGSMTTALTVSGGTPTEVAIQQLLIARNPGLQMRTWITGFTCGPLVYPPDINVWNEAQLLAQSAGGWLYHDRQGVLVFGPLLPASARPVSRYSEGDGLLLEVTRTEDSDTIHNVVVVEKAAGSAIRAVVMDTDPTSPTYAGGKYGKRVLTIQNQAVGTIQQAQQVARNQLIQELGRSETVALTVVPDPTLDVMEAITVNRPTADLYNRGLVVATIDMPLAVTDPMHITCRKFILTEDGQQVDVPLQVTTS